MAEIQSNWDSIAIGVVPVFVRLIAVALTGSFFNLLSVAIVAGVPWGDFHKLNDLRKRVAPLEEKSMAPMASDPLV